MPRRLPVFFWDVEVPDPPLEPAGLSYTAPPDEPPMYEAPALPAGPAPSGWIQPYVDLVEPAARDLDYRIPADPDLNRRNAVFGFLASSGAPAPAQDAFLTGYRQALESPQVDVNQWLRDNATPDFFGNARAGYLGSNQMGVDMLLGALTGGGIPGAVASVGFGLATEAAIDPENGLGPLRDAPPWVRDAAVTAAGFALPGRAFGGGMSMRQRALGTVGTTLGMQVGEEYGGVYGEFAGGLVGGVAGASAAPGPHAARRAAAERDINRILTELKPEYNDEAITNYLNTAYSNAKVKGTLQRQFLEQEADKMYSGPIDKTAIKELFQNAIDASRGTGGRIHIDYDTAHRRLIISDEGTGMSYNVLTHQFIDPGGSAKTEADSSGGFGRAKVVYLGQAEKLVATTTYRSRGQYVKSELTGGDLFSIINDGADADIISRSDTGKTGTIVDITLKPTARVSQDEAGKWLRNFLGRSRLPSSIYSSAAINGEAVMAIETPTYSQISKFVTSDGGAEITVFAADTNKATDSLDVHVLNNGMYQYSKEGWDGYKIDGATTLPKDLVIDIKPLVGANEPAYPFSLEREGLSPMAEQAVQSYVINDVKRAAAQAQKASLIRALDSATPTASGHRIFDMTEQLSPVWLKEMAQRPYLAEMTKKLEEYTNKWWNILRVRYPDADAAQFSGWSTNPQHYGAHIYSAKVRNGGKRVRSFADIERDVAYYNYERLTATPERQKQLDDFLGILAEERALVENGVPPNDIVINPWMSLQAAMARLGPNASNRILAEELAGEIAGTLTHEVMHARFPDHNYMRGKAFDFGRVYQDLLTQNIDLLSSTKNALKHIFYGIDLEQWKNDYRDYNEHVRNLGDPEKNIFQLASDDASAAEPGRDYGTASGGREFRAQLEGLVSAGSRNLQEGVSQGSPIVGGSHTRPGAYPGSPGQYRPERTIEIPDATAQRLADDAESIRAATGSYPPGDHPLIGAITGGVTVRGGNATLASYVNVLNHLDEADFGMSESRVGPTSRSPGWTFETLAPDTAPIDLIERQNKGKITRRREVVTDLTAPLAVYGSRAAKPSELNEVLASLLDRWSGQLKYYANSLDHYVEDVRSRLTNDRAAKAIHDKITPNARTLFMTYDTVGQIHPALRAAADADLPGLATAPDATPLTDFVPSAYHWYIDEMRQWGKDTEARDMQNLGKKKFRRIEDETHYFHGMFEHDPNRRGGRGRPGTTQPFEMRRMRVYEDPVTGDLREPLDANEEAASRARTVPEALYLFGEKLRSNELEDALRVRDFSGMHRYEGELLLDRMKRIGTATLVRGFGSARTASNIPEGWRVPDVAPWGYRNVPHSAGANAPSVIGYAVPETNARQLENAFDVNYNDVMRKGLRAVVGPITRAKLLLFQFSPFQHLDIGWRGLKAVTGFHFGQGDNILEKFANTAYIPVGALKLGSEVIAAAVNPRYRKILRDEFIGARPDADPRLALLTKHGGSPLAIQGVVSGVFTKLPDELTRFPFLGGAVDLPIGPLRLIPAALNGLTKYMSEGLFEGTYVAAWKHISLDFWDSVKHRHPEWSDNRIAQVVAENTNTLLGSVPTWRDVVQNEGVRDILRALTVSFGDPASVIRGDFRSIGKGGVSATGRAAAPEWRKMQLGMTFNLIVMANVINYAVTGEFLTPDQFSPVAWDEDAQRPKFNTRFMRPVVGFTDNGAPIFLDLMGQMDTTLRLLSPDTFLDNRLSPGARFVKGWMTNSTWDQLKAGNSKETYKYMWEKTKALGFESISPISYKNMKEGFEMTDNPAIIGAEWAGFNIHAGGLADFRRIKAQELFVIDHIDPETGRPVFRDRQPGEGKSNYDFSLDPRRLGSTSSIIVPSTDRPSFFNDLSPEQQQRIKDMPQDKELLNQTKEYFAARGDNYSATVDAIQAETKAAVTAAVDFYRSGGYLRNPKEDSLPEKFAQISRDNRTKHEAIVKAFEDTIEGFDRKTLDKNKDAYFDITVTSSDPQDKATAINWPETIARREAFIAGLPQIEQRDLNQYLDLVEQRRDPMWIEFRRDMQALRDSKYPFGTQAATAFQDKNPNADLTMWKWYGGKLNSVDTVQKALEMQAQYPQPVYLQGYTHRIDTDLASWNKHGQILGAYDELSTKARDDLMVKIPATNAIVNYWGADRAFKSQQALDEFDKLITARNWPAWSDPKVKDAVMIYLSYNDADRKKLRLAIPRIDASIALFDEYQYGHAPVFSTEAARQIYATYGKDISLLPVR